MDQPVGQDGRHNRLPTGQVLDVLRVVEQYADRNGWGTASYLMGIVDAATLALIDPDRIPGVPDRAFGDMVDGDPSTEVSFGTAETETFTISPADRLYGWDAPDHYEGLILITEGWAPASFLDDTLTEVDSHDAIADRPDLDPHRVEVRYAFSVTRDGQVISLTRPRGSEARPCVHVDVPAGRIVSLLRRALAMPAAPFPASVAHAAATLALTNAASFLEEEGGEARYDRYTDELVSPSRAVGVADLFHALLVKADSYEALPISASWDDIWQEVCAGNGLTDPEMACWLGSDLLALEFVKSLPDPRACCATLDALVPGLADQVLAALARHGAVLDPTFRGVLGLN